MAQVSILPSGSLQQLFALFKFSAPIPPTRSWAASPDLLLTIAALVAMYLSVFAITVACALTWAYQFYRPHNLEAASVALTLVAALTIFLVVIAARASRLYVSISTWIGLTKLLRRRPRQQKRPQRKGSSNNGDKGNELS